MKPKSVLHPLAKTLLVAFTLTAMPSAHSATFNWDSLITGAVGGGTSTSEATEWKTSGAGNVWWNSTSSTQASWADGNDVVFSGTAGTVYLGSAISAAVMNVATGYTIDLRDYNAGSATSAAAYNLTLTGLSGTGGVIRNTSTTTAATLTLNMAADTTWGGTIGSGGDRMNVTIQGGNILTVGGAGRNGGSGQLALTVTGAGTRLNIGGSTSTHSGNNLTVSSGATLDIGANNFSARNIVFSSDSTITTSTGGALQLNTQFAGPALAGSLTGNLKVEFVGGPGTAGTTISGSSNNFTGGLFFGNANTAGISDLTVTHNTALGTGPVVMNNSSLNTNLNIHTARIYFRSTAPTIGSLASSTSSFTKGAKSIVLGNTGLSLSGTWTSGSNTITTTSTSGLVVGQIITDTTANGLNAGSFITGITNGTQFTISSNTTAARATSTAFSSANVDTNLSIGGLNTDTTFAGVINGLGNSGITKTGTGRFTLAGAATYTGTTTVANGTLIVGSGSAQAGVNSVTTALNNNLITYGVGQMPTGLGVGQPITGTNIAAGATIIGIDVANRQVYMSAGATAAGSSTPSFGAWQSLPAATNVVLGTSTTNGTLDLNNSTQRIVGLSVGVGATAADQKVGNGSTVGDATLETTGTSNFGGVISDTLTTGNRKTNLSVVSGSLTLSGTSTYTGTTTVSAGTLIVNGNISTSTLTTVNGTGTIGGSGTVGDLTIATGGTHNPGNSPGIMSTGDYTMAGSLNIEAIGNTPGVGGYDQVNVTGTINLSGTLITSFTAGTYANGDLLFILLNDESDAVSGTFSGLAQNAFVVNYGGFDWNISYTANSTGNTFTGGNDVALMAIPEPNAAALIGGFGILALLRRRRM